MAGHNGAAVVTLASRFRDAVWEATADQITTTELAVLLAYADHARGTDTAWVAQPRLIQRCKLRSKGTPSRVLAGLVVKGWLQLLTPAQWRNKQSPTYRLLIPTAPSDGAVDESKPPRSKRKPPRQVRKPPRQVRETAPMSGPNRPVNRTPLSYSEGPSRPSERGNSPRTAPPHDEPLPEEQPRDPLTADEAKAQARAIASRYGRAPTTHWKLGTAPQGEPNPFYDPAAVLGEKPEDTND